MTFGRLLFESVTHYWRTNVAVLLGSFVGASVLTGALLVGDSMRGTLREMALERLGRIDQVVVGDKFFRQDLAERFRTVLGDDSFPAASVILLQGSVGTPDKRRRVSQVQVVGTTPEFWRLFPGSEPPPAGQVAMNERLAGLLGIDAKGQPQRPTRIPLVFYAFGQEDVPRESALGRRDEPPKPMPVIVDRILPNTGVGQFSLQLSQVIPPILFVPIEQLARGMEVPGRANALFLGETTETEIHAPLEQALRESVSLDDLGVELAPAMEWISIQTREKIIPPDVGEPIVAMAKERGWTAQRVLAYLANSMTALSSTGEPMGKREIPYSIVAAIDFVDSAPFGPMPARPRLDLAKLPPGHIVVNEWTAQQWGIDASRPNGDSEGDGSLGVRLTYFVVEANGSLKEQTHDFELAGVVAMEGVALDPGYVPAYKGITDATTVNDWDAPFQLTRTIENADEEYWKAHKTAPKAFLRLDDGQEIWKTRFGDLTSIRIAIPAGETAESFLPTLSQSIRQALPVERLGFSLHAIREQNLEASSGSTDFGMLFLSMSFFLIMSAALLVGLLFRLNTELRASSIGVLLAVGWTPGQTRGLLLAEGVFLAATGSLFGLAGGALYAKWILELLSTWWRSAVGTNFLDFHATWLSFAIGWGSSVVVATMAVWWATARIAHVSVPRLLSAGAAFADQPERSRGRWSPIVAALGIAVGLGLMAAGMAGMVSDLAAFFGAAGAILVGAIALVANVISTRRNGEFASLLRGGTPATIARLAGRNTARFRTRSLVSMTLLALAVFLVVAVGCMRRAAPAGQPSKDSGNGGFSLLATAATPLPRDLDTQAARAAMNITEQTENLLATSEIHGFRVRPGEDASCLNVYQPTDPTILGAPPSFVQRGGFAFRTSLAETAGERDNPWTLLDKDFGDGVIPAIGDAATLQWILKVPVGQELSIKDESGAPVTLKIVGGLSSSIFQGQLIISEENFWKLFPSRFGKSLFVIATENSGDVAKDLNADLAEFGFEVRATSDVIAGYLAVQETYMAAFEMLGGLGLILGTLGLAAVLVRNVLERRGEIALLEAVGFGRGWIAALILCETATVVALGLMLGTACALIAVAPQFRDIDLSAALPLLGILASVALTGLVAGLIAVWTVLRLPLLQSLRAERA